ncbi:right-handed parallel beta-helix repeat-containing protein [Candidatus Micrarchaeota archaeon]|nr:right-handed parallel beta-helix repeat-containing protein [Candidatus Micrarchaeota archaeon]
MPRKAQASLEHVILIGALLFFVAIIIVITKTNVLYGGSETTKTNVQQLSTAINAVCDLGIPCPTGYDCAANGSCIAGCIGTTVTSCITISSPGSYCVESNLSSSGTCITISANDVSFDCHNHAITGPTGSGYGVSLWHVNNATVKRCTVKQFATGVYLYDSATNNLIEDNLLTGNNIGAQTGAMGSNSGNNFSYNNISSNTQLGLDISYALNGAIEQNEIRYNSMGGISSYWGGGHFIANNEITDNGGYGINFFTPSSKSTIYSNNLSANNNCGIYLYGPGAPGHNISYNEISYTSGSPGAICGTTWAPDTIIEHNTMNNNLYGVYLTGGLMSQFNYNTLCDNTNYDVYVSNAQVASVAGNTCGAGKCYQGGVWGICMPNVAGAGNCNHCCSGNCLPAVSLNEPTNGATLAKGEVVSFNYTPSDEVGFKNATLYTDEDGTWKAYESNSTPITNGAKNTIAHTITTTSGTYAWNVLACDTDDACSWAASNYSFTIPCDPGEICYCGYSVGSPGNYYLSENLSCVVSGIAVNANDVRIDCNGHEISGPGGFTGIATAALASNITVFNCTIKNYNYAIRYVSNTDSRIIENRLENNWAGVWLSEWYGIAMQTLIENNTIDNTNYAVYLESSSLENQSNIMRNNTLTNGATSWASGIEVHSGNNTIENNRVSNYYYGIIVGAAYTQIKNNFISSSAEGIIFYNINYSLVYGNAITNASFAGVYTSDGSNANISYNEINDSNYGIMAQLGVPLQNSNISYNKITNTTSSGIWLYGSQYNTVSYNNVSYNQGYGAEFFDVSNNTIAYNNITRNGYTGLYFATYTISTEYNTALGNTITNNSNGIFFAGYNDTLRTRYNNVSSNTIDDNSAVGVHVYDSYSDSNYFTDNQICGSTSTAFAVYASQNPASGNKCDAGKCYQTDAHNVCVPNVAGYGNCNNAC